MKIQAVHDLMKAYGELPVGLPKRMSGLKNKGVKARYRQIKHEEALERNDFTPTERLSNKRGRRSRAMGAA